ncbi:MAG: 2-amino-4-hydroxy-6-hydroxymethyldihydropteridine diphosphokinase [Pseudomonadota bacterium]
MVRLSEQKQHIALLASGSNMHDPIQAIKTANGFIKKQFDVIKCAGLYRSKAMYETDQADFVNSALMIKTNLQPEALLKTLKSLEQKIGRVKSYRFGPRLIDLDIIYYGDQKIELEHLMIPHPRRLERNFVMIPLSEIAPDFIDPENNQKLHILAAQNRIDDLIKICDPADTKN